MAPLPLRWILLLIAGLMTSALQAQALPPALTAKFIKIIVSASGNSVACDEPDLKAALEAEGVKVDPGAKAVWVTNAAKAKMAKSMNRLIIGPAANLISQGAAVVVMEQGGRPKILVNPANVKASGVTLPDAIFKVGEVQ